AELDTRLGRSALAPADLSDERLRRAMRNDEALSLYGWTPYMHNPKLAGRLHRIACPTLIAWGAADALVAPAYRAVFAAALPDADTLLVEEAGHRLHADQPGEIAARIAAFAAR
ncbi:MAG TPA: hypothetical protein VNQ31_05215, partial [Sphingomonadaceae bacterium]|nr:hypothetical protein [Sphingomonadaceae bacterium]